jgi:hypothetical protein
LFIFTISHISRASMLKGGPSMFHTGPVGTRILPGPSPGMQEAFRRVVPSGIAE